VEDDAILPWQATSMRMNRIFRRVAVRDAVEMCRNLVLLFSGLIAGAVCAGAGDAAGLRSRATAPFPPALCAAWPDPCAAVLAVPAVSPGPRKPRRDFWLGKDKGDHFVISGFLVGFAYYAARQELHRSDPASKNLAAGFSLSLGVLKELRDQRRPGNFFSLKDLAADLAGLGLGYALCTAGAQ